MRKSLLIPASTLMMVISIWTAWQQGRRQGLAEAAGPMAALRKSDPADALAAPGARTEAPDSGARRPAGTEAATGADGPLPPADSPQFAVRVREVFADPFENRRLARLQLLLEQCSTDQFAAMVPLIRENDLRGTGSGEEWELVMQNWGRRDGAGVMDFISGYDWKGWHPLSGPGGRYEALVGWATADPQAALGYFSDPAHGMSQDGNLQRALIMGWVAKDPEAAARWVLAPEQSAITSQAHQLIVDAICRKGGQQMLDQWFSSLPADSESLPLMARAVAQAKNRFEPEKAAEWIESQKGKPWVEDGSLVTNTAMQMADRDPAAALAWAERAGSGAAMSTAMQAWCVRDVQAASEWLKANPSTAHYDQAAVQLIGTIAAGDPEAAQAWAGTIRDDALRLATMERLSTRKD